MITGRIRDVLTINDRIVAVTLDVMRVEAVDVAALHAAYARGDKVRLVLEGERGVTRPSEREAPVSSQGN